MRWSRAIACPCVLAIALAITLVITLGACATRVQVPEIPVLDSAAFAATRADPDIRPTVKYVEVPKIGRAHV